MDKWEYLTEFNFAHIDNKGAREHQKKNWPNKKKTRKFSPQTMIPRLNARGKEGWELIHMEPVAAVGQNDDIRFLGSSNTWSNAYFCVFKRRVE